MKKLEELLQESKVVSGDYTMVPTYIWHMLLEALEYEDIDVVLIKEQEPEHDTLDEPYEVRQT